MKLVQHNLISKGNCKENLRFYGSDTWELYYKNLNEKPKDWFYRNNPITYKFNSHGFRCKEISELNFNDYILFLGDSIPEGVGLHLENTYPYLLSQKLKKTYYNLSIGGSGIDTMFYNLLTWLNTFPLPKYVVLFWSDPSRCLRKEKQESFFSTFSINHHPNITQEQNFKNFLADGEIIGFFDGRAILYEKMVDSLFKFHNLPYKNITILPNLYSNSIEVIDVKDKPLSRDIHPGIEVHNNICDILYKDYTDKYSNATVNSTIRGQI